eukprot:TRINITY_DN1336_c0_g1_i5.p1 TRINITY_DN1336_c0_g1~~TRINITY_DN1336_c0_g1_i5.p1  ORF type:complete len:266 (-),score=45.99 TRINITY_DN1336_c0_g1_i5:216-899(-)
MTGDAAEPWARELRLAAAFVVLSPYGPMQKDLLHRLSGDKALANLPEYKALRQALHHLRADPATGPHGPLWGGARQPHCGRPQRRRGGAELDWQEPLKQRVTEHNLRVCALYYTRIPLARLATLLDTTERDAESKGVGNGVGQKVAAGQDGPPRRKCCFPLATGARGDAQHLGGKRHQAADAGGDDAQPYPQGDDGAHARQGGASGGCYGLGACGRCRGGEETPAAA